jgi:DNA polymerase-3 subunit delta
MTIHIIFGDVFLVQEAINQFDDAIGHNDVRDSNTHYLNGTKVSLTEIIDVSQTLPFLADKRLVIVDGLLGKYESNNRRSSRTASSAQSLEEWKDLKSLQSLIPDSTILIFKDNNVSPRNTLFRKLRGESQVLSLPTPKGEALSRWIKTRANAKNTTIQPGSIRLIVQFIGPDLWTIDNELEKLSVYVGGRSIEERDVRTIVSQVRESSIFTAIDATLEGRWNIAIKLLKEIYNDGSSFQYIISMLSRQLRLNILAKELLQTNHSSREIADRLSIKQDFVVQKTLTQARAHSLNKLLEYQKHLLNADLSVKRGIQSENVMLELLVSQISLRN